MSLAMTPEEAQIALKHLRPRVREYARLLIGEGINLQKGQELVVTAPIESYRFVREVVRAGYELGAGHVTVIWTDDVITRAEYEYTPESWFEVVPEWKRVQMNSLAEQGAGFLMIEGAGPDALKGVDPQKMAVSRKAKATQCDVWRHNMDFNVNAWCIGGAPTRDWAKKVFPEVSGHEAIVKLWNAILDVARVTDDPIREWERHNATLEKNLRSLNDYHFDRLHYKSENGTDFTLGLTDKHIWEGGSATTEAGVIFFPNMPTEEVFTTPDRNRAEGVVHSALPLVHGGQVVENFWFEFKDGAVVDLGAEQGKDVLEAIVNTDEGARHLGECALISKNTPIRESGLLFYSTLYDENASCHLALGKGFPDCYEGGTELTADELLARGVNQSAQHVDFMIGADDLDITGITKDGEEIPVFVNGQWAWER